MIKNKLAENAHLSTQEIKALMVLNGVTQASIALELGVSRSCVAVVVGGFETSRRVQQAVADKLGLPFEQVWGHPTRTRRAA